MERRGPRRSKDIATSQWPLFVGTVALQIKSAALGFDNPARKQGWDRDSVTRSTHGRGVGPPQVVGSASSAAVLLCSQCLWSGRVCTRALLGSDQASPSQNISQTKRVREAPLKWVPVERVRTSASHALRQGAPLPPAGRARVRPPQRSAALLQARGVGGLLPNDLSVATAGDHPTAPEK